MHLKSTHMRKVQLQASYYPVANFGNTAGPHLPIQLPSGTCSTRLLVHQAFLLELLATQSLHSDRAAPGS